MKKADSEIECVYVVRNPCIPGLVKIGRSAEPTPERRLDELSGTSVPADFIVETFARCLNSELIETRLSCIFDAGRYCNYKEFYAVEPEKIRGALLSMNEVEVASAKECDAINAKFAKRRTAKMDYIDMGLKIGDLLVYDDGKGNIYQLEVASGRHVLYQGEPMELGTAITRIFGADTKINYTHWKHKGISLLRYYKNCYHPNK